MIEIILNFKNDTLLYDVFIVLWQTNHLHTLKHN